MKTIKTETGGVLVTALLVTVLLATLGGVVVNLAWTENEATYQSLGEYTSRFLAESGAQQVIAWYTQGEVPARANFSVFKGTETSPDVDFRSARLDDDRLLNDPNSGWFRDLQDIGRILNLRLYGPSHPEGLCAVEVTAESKRGVRRSVAVELGATRIPPMLAAIHAGPSDPGRGSPRVWGHWGPMWLAGDASLGRSDQFPQRYDYAPVTGFSYGDSRANLEDRWFEARTGGAARFEDSPPSLPANVFMNQDPVPGLPSNPWQYKKFKELAMQFGSYYVPDSDGRLYPDGQKDPALAKTPAQVFGAGDHASRGLVFIDTLDQTAPSATNLPTLVVDAPYVEGAFYVNAHVILRPDGTGRSIPALSPPAESTPGAVARVPVSLEQVTIRGVLVTSGSLNVDRDTRVFGAVIAGQGLMGSGLLEVWYDHDLRRGLVPGLPVVFPVRGTWREWGS